jgi:hypothetical protein
MIVVEKRERKDSMNSDQVIGQLLLLKKSHNVSFFQLANTIGKDEEWVAKVLLRRIACPPELAQKIGDELHLSSELIRTLTRHPNTDNQDNSEEKTSKGYVRNLLTMIFDKIVLGIIAAIVVMIFQTKSHQYQTLIDKSHNVSQIYSSLLKNGVDELTKAMENYFSKLEEIKPHHNTLRDLKDGKGYEAIKYLKDLELKISLIIENTKIVDYEREHSTECLLKQIESLNKLLNKQFHVMSIKKEEIELEVRESKIRKCYFESLKVIQDALIKTVEYEYKKSLDSINSWTIFGVN